ncbi:MAG: 1-acyl-sn-glycerol-3-phosphate acyltransferase [Desulfobacterales bacterium]|nr:1-acyl-sn-glycerol-3-phosphate acyltransferase [Desulfobacterales bacterium]
MLNRIVSIFYLIFIGITSAFFYIIALAIWLVTKPFDQRLVFLHLFSCFWASLYIWIMPAWKVFVEHKHKIQKDATYVVVSNHQSQLDILVVFTIFFHFKWVSKEEVFRLPFIGWNMSLNEYIKLKRGDGRSVERMFKQCEKTISQGSSVYFFPEGTRSETGELKVFKPGAFILAKKMKTPILPIVINGTRKALPKHSLNFHGKNDIHVKILDPIDYSVFADMEVEKIAEMIRQKIAEHVRH